MTAKARFSSTRRRLYFRWFGADGELRRDLRSTDRVLDVGCSDGRGSELLTGSTGCDIYRPALSSARTTGRRRPVVQADLRNLPFRASSFDVVTSLDVVEHFDKPDALLVMDELERVASRLVAVLTPSGFVPQPPGEDEPWQEHRCGFDAADLEERGYTVVGVGGHRALRSDYASLRFGPLGVLAALVTRLTHRRAPARSFHIYGRKDVHRS